MPLSSRFTAQAIADHTNVPGAMDLATVAAMSFPLRFNRDYSLGDGTGAGNADRLFSDRRSTAANDDLDLAGVLTDAFGATLTFARIKGIMVAAAAANVGNVVIGGGTNPWITLLTAGTIVLRPGAVFCAFAGTADATAWGVTAGTGDILRIASSSGTVEYDIAIVGVSA